MPCGHKFVSELAVDGSRNRNTMGKNTIRKWTAVKEKTIPFS